uniref:Uncharacterized protein n=1 Tax=Arundo donax TaxID=35708 RepID=A0A0A9GHH8_ARUDO
MIAALGTNGHRGHVRIISSIICWHDVFPEDAESYKKRDFYKMEPQEVIRDEVKRSSFNFLEKQATRMAGQPKMEFIHPAAFLQNI